MKLLNNLVVEAALLMLTIHNDFSLFNGNKCFVVLLELHEPKPFFRK